MLLIEKGNQVKN